MSSPRPKNSRTSFLDGSAIYGVSDEQNKAIRLGQNGILKSYFKKNKRSEFMIDDGINDMLPCVLWLYQRKFYP
ncbi:hypothetical protein B4U80_14256 [Leptotrombidium deliense]|uniref:Uncharacterized protein n=1 Tax=Leptotrombidium deliense TaxID=299467 RepID=A0A443RZ71_9ACAR|nr:hypothetical protein B4U80_14256 [Leptotrombidium deliense]